MRQVTIEVSDQVAEFLDARGVELSALRESSSGEYAFDGGCTRPGMYKTNGGVYVLILKAQFTPPDWLQPGWIVTNYGKIWFHCKDEPQRRPDGRYSITGMMISPTMLRWTPPTVTGPTKYQVK